MTATFTILNGEHNNQETFQVSGVSKNKKKLWVKLETDRNGGHSIDQYYELEHFQQNTEEDKTIENSVLQNMANEWEQNNFPL